MFWTDTKRIIKSGYKNFTRNGMVSFASVLIITVTLCVITFVLFSQVALNYSLEQMKGKVDVTVYFTTTAPEDSILNLKSSLEKLPEVAGVTYVSSEDALAKFRDKHANDYLTIQALDELSGNPLGASLNIKAKDPSQYESIVTFFEGDTGLAKDASSIIDNINYHKNKVVIDRLTRIITSAQELGFLITLILIIIAIIITFNTIRLTIFISKEEIEVMRLVGAANRYIRGPFIIDGIIYGVISSLVTMILFYPVTFWLGNTMTAFFGLNLYEYYLNNFFQIFGILLLAGSLLGMIASSLAVRKYLKK